MVRKMYHTQEKRDRRLTKPIPCDRPDAWLGGGYYFWHDIDDAHMWGKKSKKATGSYEIYSAEIDCENVIDTVFNEEIYLWWVKQIERAAKHLRELRSSKQNPTLKQLNDYLKGIPEWKDVVGVLFQDVPDGYEYSVIAPIEYRNKKTYFAYKKRIQLALYKRQYMSKFSFVLTNKC